MNDIESPFYPASPFAITMKLNGQEKDFTITEVTSITG